jgi:ribosomal protein L40E
VPASFDGLTDEGAMIDFAWWAAIEARGVGEDARRESATLADQVRALERRVEVQATVLQALARLLAERLGLSDAEVLEYVQRAEAERQAAERRTCTKCGNRLPPRKTRCIYCGEDHPPQAVADAV